jgi:hypothetical protein
MTNLIKVGIAAVVLLVEVAIPIAAGPLEDGLSRLRPIAMPY